MFQSKIEETKNQLNKATMANSTVIQSFYDGSNIFITGGTGEFAFLLVARNYRRQMNFPSRQSSFTFSRLHGKGPDR